MYRRSLLNIRRLHFNSSFSSLLINRTFYTSLNSKLWSNKSYIKPNNTFFHSNISNYRFINTDNKVDNNDDKPPDLDEDEIIKEDDDNIDDTSTNNSTNNNSKEEKPPELEDEEIYDQKAHESNPTKWLKYAMLYATLYLIAEYYDWAPYVLYSPLNSIKQNIESTKKTGEHVSSIHFKLISWMINTSNNVLYEFVKQDGIDILIEVISLAEAGIIPMSNLRDIANIFQSLSNNDDILKILPKYPGLMSSFLKMSISNDRELSVSSFLVIRNYLRNEMLKKEFISLGGLNILCRAVRAQDPEVTGVASQLLGSFLYEFPDPRNLNLTSREMQSMFMAVTNMGGMFYEFGNYELAISAFTIALKLDPKNPDLLTQVGILLTDSDDEIKRLQGRKYLRQALNISKANAQSSFYLASSIARELRIQKPNNWIYEKRGFTKHY